MSGNSENAQTTVDLRRRITELVREVRSLDEEIGAELRNLRSVRRKLKDLISQLRAKKRELRSGLTENENIDEWISTIKRDIRACEGEVDVALKRDVIKAAEEAEKRAEEAERRAEEAEKQAEEAKRRAEEAEKRVKAAEEIAFEAMRRKEDAEKRAEENLRQLKYLKADFENFKKRVEREKAEFADYIISKFASEIINVMDDLERAIEHAHRMISASEASSEASQASEASETSEASEASSAVNERGGSVAPLIKGVEMTLARLKEMLRAEGIEEMKVEVGEKFDPFKHEVFAREESEEHPEGTVLEVLRKGYVYKGKILRPAMVKTAVKKSGGEK